MSQVYQIANDYVDRYAALNPVAATYHIGIRGFSAVSGLTLTTSYQ